MKNIRCKLFGHLMDEDSMMQNNIQFCLRCHDTREGVYYDRDVPYWTDLQYYGLIGYPIWRLKNYIWSKYIWVKLKMDKLKVNNKDDFDPDLPF